jgi:hypothetical protein
LERRKAESEGRFRSHFDVIDPESLPKTLISIEIRNFTNAKFKHTLIVIPCLSCAGNCPRKPGNLGTCIPHESIPLE